MLIFLLSIWYITTVLCWILAGLFINVKEHDVLFYFLTSIPIINIFGLIIICHDIVVTRNS
jgi:hypothetical protein